MDNLKEATGSFKANVIAKEIIDLFEEFGNEDYDGERVTQREHMVQCAMLAMQEDNEDELVLGALLHDIGHLLRHRQPVEIMGDYGVVNHESIGAAYLREKEFSEKICVVVEMHVAAKRYLVAVDADYKNKLSEASWQTLQFQGGPMTKTEADKLEEHPYFEEIIKVRLWDEEAKEQNVPMLPLSHFEKLINYHLNNRLK